MAGDYIPFDHDFPEKPEVLAIHEATDTPIGEIMLRLHRFWRAVDRQTEDGILRGVGTRSLALLCGGDQVFWEAVQAVGWLTIRDDSVAMPGFKERLAGRKGCAKQRIKWAQKKRRQRERQRGDMSPLSPGTTARQPGGQDGRQDGRQLTNQNQNQISPSSLRSEGESAPRKTPSPPAWLGQVLFPEGMDSPEVRESIAAWYVWLEQRGRPALDPAMEASQLLRCFGTGAELVASVGYAIGNRCVTLKNYAREHAGRDGGAKGRPQRPTVDVGAIMRQKAAEKGEEYHG